MQCNTLQIYICALQVSVVIVIRNFNHRQKCLLSDTMTTQRSVVTGIQQLPGSYREHTLS
jgi:hypothetical protein